MHSADDSIQFYFGQYSVCITGSRELVKILSVNWAAFTQVRGKVYDRIHIHIEETEIQGGTELPDGWMLQEECGYRQAAYSQRGKIRFALQLGSNQDMLVRVSRILSSYVFTAIHFSMLCALYHKCLGLHGVTVLCGDQIIILSAPSGTGKTTLANLLEKYCDAIVINGDTALLSPTMEGVIFEPTPFCGTSGRCLNHRVRVNRVVFLEQSLINHWSTLTGREAMARFMSNAFVPSWNQPMKQAVQGNIMRCIDSLKVNSYAFAPTKEAAEMFVQSILQQ